MELTIDTSQPGSVAVYLTRAGGVVARAQAVSRHHGTERVLPLVARVLSARRRPQAIRVVAAAVKHAGFTQLRAGVVAANALAYAWRVPLAAVGGASAVSSKRPDPRHQFSIQPRYGKPPSVTLRSR